jgi:hypothetical protein
MARLTANYYPIPIESEEPYGPDYPFRLDEVRVNYENLRLVVTSSIMWDVDEQRLSVTVHDLFDEKDSYKIEPRKLGPALNEMEILAWASL